MELIYPFLISFIMIFIAELGDKTQLLVLSFSGGIKTKNIILGIIIGSFFSHGIAILFGSSIRFLENNFINIFIKLITYSSFIIIGIISLLPKKELISTDNNKKGSILQIISKLHISYTFIIALSILIGEIGDKTFLASLGFGIQYPHSKIMLILGSIFGMVLSNSIAIISGKFLSKYISQYTVQKFSGILFLIFGLLGFIFR